MDAGGGAFGGSMAGASQDPVSFVKKPTVMLRIACLVREGEKEKASYDTRVLAAASVCG